jgi:hypothetical protein
MNTDEFFSEAKRLKLRMLGTPEETRAALDAKDAEIARLTAALKKANEQAERFERGWYLRGDALEWIVEATTATPALTEAGLGVVLSQIGRKASEGLRA